MTDAGSISIGLAFVAGLVSFLSPCVLPLVPSYITFVTGMTLDQLTDGDARAGRRRAALHAGLFVLGFGLVFVALGATATALGFALRGWMPVIQQIGGIAIVVFGLYLLGVLRFGMLGRERRVHLAAKPAGMAGSVVVGAAFGAGWTPCIGPVLASILLYSGMQATMGQGILLLVAYTLGLGLPFFVSAVALNWYLAGAKHVRRWLRPIERVAGALLLIVGVLLVSGRFTMLSSFLAGFGQFFDVGI